MDKEKDYAEVFRFLRINDIDPDDALYLLRRHAIFNENNKSSAWKLKRFQFFLWARLREEKEGYLPKKAETIRKLVYSKQYKKEFDKFWGPMKSIYQKPIWAADEFRKLNNLVTDPRQFRLFKSKYFVYENTKTNNA